MTTNSADTRFFVHFSELEPTEFNELYQAINFEMMETWESFSTMEEAQRFASILTDDPTVRITSEEVPF